jgi:inner membrane protein
MSPVTHLLTGWLTAQTAELSRRDRILVTLSGVAPDIDALGVLVELATKNTSTPLYWWSYYHHVLCHNVGFALLLATAVALLAARRWMTVLLAGVAFHLHLLGDLVGSKGPDGYQWPIPYLLPFSDRWQLTWQGQWGLNAWPNILLTALFLAVSLYMACKRGYSPLELISKRVDKAFVAALRKRIGAVAGSCKQQET